MAFLPAFLQSFEIEFQEVGQRSFDARLRRDPEGWWLRLVQLADRARRLDQLLELAAARRPDNHNLAALLDTARTWEIALGGKRAGA